MPPLQVSSIAWDPLALKWERKRAQTVFMERSELNKISKPFTGNTKFVEAKTLATVTVDW